MNPRVVSLSSVAMPGYYSEFLRVASMSLGLYKHAAGVQILQKPHAEDEVYHVIAGRGKIAVADVDYEVEPGSVIYVPAQVEHHFHSVTEELSVLVVFAPAETT